MERTGYLQKLEKALDLKGFISEAESVLNRVYDDSDDTDSENELVQKRPTYDEKELMYNAAENIDEERKWLYDVLLSDTESDSEITDEDRYIAEMLKEHAQEKKLREKYHQNPSVSSKILYKYAKI